MRWLDDPRVQLMGALLVTTLLFVYVVRRIISHFEKKAEQNAPAESRAMWLQLIHVAIGPLSLLVWYYGIYAMARVATNSSWLPNDFDWIEHALRQVAGIGFVIA